MREKHECCTRHGGQVKAPRRRPQELGSWRTTRSRLFPKLFLYYLGHQNQLVDHFLNGPKEATLAVSETATEEETGDEAEQRAGEQRHNAKASVGLLVHFAVGILVHLRYQLDGGLIGQVQHLVLSRGLLHPAVDLGKGMDIGRPLGALADEEAQLIVVGPSRL